MCDIFICFNFTVIDLTDIICYHKYDEHSKRACGIIYIGDIMNNAKQFLSVILALTICFSFATTSFADDGVNIEEAFDLTTEFLDEFYNATLLHQPCDFSEYIGPRALLQYVNAYTALMQTNHTFGGVMYLETEYKYLEVTDLGGGYIRFAVSVRARFQYKGAESRSAIGRLWELVVHCNDGDYSIVDVFETFTFMNGQRGVENKGGYLEEYDPNFWNDPDKFLSPLLDMNDYCHTVLQKNVESINKHSEYDEQREEKLLRLREFAELLVRRKEESRKTEICAPDEPRFTASQRPNIDEKPSLVK